MLGVVSLWVCLSSAVDAYAMSLFWMHMIEHLTLIMLVPALLVLGHPLTVLRASGGEGWQERFDRFMYSPPIAILTHPFVGMAVYAVVVFYTHLTPFMDRMAENPHLMVAEQLAYISAGWLMLLSLIGEEPIRWQTPYLLRLALLIVAMIPDTFVGIILLQTQKDPFPMYMAMRPPWAPPALRDLDIGGSLDVVGRRRADDAAERGHRDFPHLRADQRPDPRPLARVGPHQQPRGPGGTHRWPRRGNAWRGY